MNKGYAKKLGCLFFSPFSTSLISGCEHFLNTQTQEPTCPGEEKKAPIQIPGNLGEGDWAGRALPGPLLAVWIWTLKGGMKVGEPATPPPISEGSVRGVDGGLQTEISSLLSHFS